MTKNVRFNSQPEFYRTLTARVNHYFKEKEKSKFGNRKMVVKTIFMFLLYFAPYALIVSNQISNPWILLSLAAMLGVGAAGIGLSVMHDACHGSYSRYRPLNAVLGYSMNLIGGCAFNWKVQHNVFHHSYTNVDGLDEDIAPAGILRFSPHAKWYQIHKYQFLYSWFFYGLMTLSWLVFKDFRQLRSYTRSGMIKKQKSTVTKEWLVLFGSKLFFFAYMFVIPLLVTDLTWWQVLLGLVVMHFITGFLLAIIFQPAHVVPDADFPVSDSSGNMQNDWAIHQLLTTMNFAPKSRIFSWFVGGLNFQIEHHLFPNICHVHYKSIAEIVRTTASEFNLPYYSKPTFMHAIWSHARMLYALGRPVPVS